MTDFFLRPVRLVSDHYQRQGVAPGETGIVVENWGDGAYEVEFTNPATGETIALLTLRDVEFEPMQLDDAPATLRTGD